MDQDTLAAARTHDARIDHDRREGDPHDGGPNFVDDTLMDESIESQSRAPHDARLEPETDDMGETLSQKSTLFEGAEFDEACRRIAQGDPRPSPEGEQVEPTDKSRAAGIRQIVHALNIAVREAGRAGLCVELKLTVSFSINTIVPLEILSVDRISREVC